MFIRDVSRLILVWFGLLIGVGDASTARADQLDPYVLDLPGLGFSVDLLEDPAGKFVYEESRVKGVTVRWDVGDPDDKHYLTLTFHPKEPAGKAQCRDAEDPMGLMA